VGAYGKTTLKTPASRLTLEFGKGCDECNLRNIRTCFIAFPIRDALRHELSWTHYRLLCRLDGILLCSQKDEAILKYSVLNDKNNLFAVIPPLSAKRRRTESAY
jgi:hypothetical protein